MLRRVNLIWHFGELFYYCAINYAHTVAYLDGHLVISPIWFIFGCVYVTTCMVSWRLKSGVYLGPNIRPAGLFIAAIFLNPHLPQVKMFYVKNMFLENP